MATDKPATLGCECLNRSSYTPAFCPGMARETSFEAGVERALMELRQRLLADVHAASENDPMAGGIRSFWKSRVRLLARLRSTAAPASSSCASLSPPMKPTGQCPSAESRSQRLG